jgi:hypothetical protein
VAGERKLLVHEVMIDNQKDTVSVGIRKSDGLTASAPVKADCGLVVDVNHISNMSTGSVIAPIECLVNGTLRNTTLFQKSYLQNLTYTYQPL